MNPLSAIIFDIEIINAIPPKDPALRLPDISYCEGWGDHRGMGISVLCAWDCLRKRPLVYLAEDLGEFAALISERDLLVGFNSVKFDEALLAANGIQKPAHVRSYDILREAWRAAGANPNGPFSKETHGGFSLEDCGHANFGYGKVLNGELAPIEWQRGKRSKVINYCADDVALTLELFEQIIERGIIYDPRYSFREIPLVVKKPEIR